MPDLPAGTVTFFFTDIEGSTKLWEREPAAMGVAVARHDALVRKAIERHSGHVFMTAGDAFCAAFQTAASALAAACDSQTALAQEPWAEQARIKVRMALHTGVAEIRDHDYFGQPLNRVARLLAAGHGGQVLLSAAVHEQVRDHLPPGITLRDMGERRLKDLVRSERVYQAVLPALPADFPPLKTLDARAHNLPIQPTSFVGREQDMQEIKALLRSSRLTTLTGSGGAGKTRLALQVGAEQIDDFADGVWLVELAPLADPRLILQELASLLGVREERGAELLATLVKTLKDYELLLLLDNCEHVVEASARLCDALLAGCANVRILATSREALRVSGEATFRVPSLAVPEPEAKVAVESLRQYAAIHLFVDRAVAVQSSFRIDQRNAATIANICYHLDGIPLAIELAAARVRSISVDDMNERLDERFRLLTGGARTALPRQQTLRAAIEWSYDLLDDAEKKLFARLSVFSGGSTLLAAERICCGAGVDAPEVLDLMTALVDKSLLLMEERHTPTRYRFLENVQQYARDRLRDDGEESRLRARHLAHCVALAEEAGPELRGKDQHAWLDCLEAEHDNLRAALMFASSPGADPVNGLRLAAAVFGFWSVRGYLTEGRSWLSAMVAAVPDGVADGTRATALKGAGYIAWQQSDYVASRALLERSLAICRSLGDRNGVANSLIALGLVAKDQNEYERARALQEESLSIHRELGNSRGIAVALANLATISGEIGQFSAARAQFAESSQVFRALGDKQNIAMSLHSIGYFAYQEGDYASAEAHQGQSLALWRELGDRRGVALALGNLGLTVAAQGNHVQARLLQEESLEIRKALGDRRGMAISLSDLGEVFTDQGDHVRARALYRESLSISRPIGDRLCVAAALESLAASVGESMRAASLWGGAERMRQEINAPLPPRKRSRYDTQVAKARAGSSDHGAFDEAWQRGRAMTAERIIEFALEPDAAVRVLE
jgi:predicted ATPase/class 3 adenylate cyclase